MKSRDQREGGYAGFATRAYYANNRKHVRDCHRLEGPSNYMASLVELERFYYRVTLPRMSKAWQFMQSLTDI